MTSVNRELAAEILDESCFPIGCTRFCAGGGGGGGAPPAAEPKALGSPD